MDGEKIIFNGQNWTIFKFATIVKLRSKGVFAVVSNNVPQKFETEEDKTIWVDQDSRAQEIIVSRLAASQITYVLTCDTAHEIWEKLKSIYEPISETQKHVLLGKFFTLKFGDNVLQYLAEIEELVMRLKQIGENISESMIVTKILTSLPENYKHFVTAFESAANQSLQELTSRLRVEEDRHKCNETPEAMPAQSSELPQNCSFCHGSHNIRDCEARKKLVCEYCKKPGHTISRCWFRKNKSHKTQELASMANAFVAGSSEDWIVDSGASHHMCKDETLFFNLVRSSCKGVRIGDGTELEVRGEGKVQLQAWNGTQFVNTELSAVLFVPALKVNLFSISKVLDKGYFLKSCKKYCKIVDNNGNIRILAERAGNLFKLKVKPLCINIECSFPYSMTCHVSLTLSDWHKSLAHQNTEYVRNFLINNNIKFVNNQEKCRDCIINKQHRISFTPSTSRASRPCDLIHSDLCGPFEQESIGGAKYFMLLKDDFSGFRFVYFLKHKNEVATVLKTFLASVQNMTGRNIKTLRTDNGSEFVNSSVIELLCRYGIEHQKSVVYTPQQNGRAEREMRTLTEAARTMINSRNLGKEFWAEAINTAVYVINRTGPTNVENKSPAQLWFSNDKPFNATLLKEFGVEVAALIPKQKRQKLDPKSRIGIFVGYGEQTKGYRVYFKDTGKVEMLCDVLTLPERNNQNASNTVPRITTTIHYDSDDENDEEVTLPIVNNVNRQVCDSLSEVGPPDALNLSPSTSSGFQTPISETPPPAGLSNESDDWSSRLRPRTHRPNYFDDYECYFGEIDLVEPQTYKEAITCDKSDEWMKAMKSEIDALEINDTWVIVDKPVGKEVIDSKWVYKLKRDEFGNIKTYKARLVARGFLQKDMVFKDIYSPVARLTTVRIFMAMSLKYNAYVHQMDVCNAFLNGEVQEDIYMSLPRGFEVDNNKVCKLQKSLYGLKCAPKCWNMKFNEFMFKYGFKRSEYDSCLYVKRDNDCYMFVLLFVDDLLVLGTAESQVIEFKKVLGNTFRMRDLGMINHYLGIVFNKNANSITLNQCKYLENVLKKFDMLECNGVSTPIEQNFDHKQLLRKKSETVQIENKCRQLIGCLTYVMLCTRPDLCVSINILSRYQSCASNDLWIALKRILRYVKNTIDYKLTYTCQGVDLLSGYADADWAGDTTDRKSTSGYVFFLFGCPVSWVSKKQTSVAKSSTEAEYLALSLAASEACWLRNICSDFCIDIPHVVMYEDNMSTISLCNNEWKHGRLKHVDIHYHFIREKVRDKVIKLNYISSSEQIADICTKPLPAVTFKKFVIKLCLT